MTAVTFKFHFVSPATPQRLAPGGPDSESQGSRSGHPQLTGSQGPGLLCPGVLDVPSARVACASTSEMFLQSMTRVTAPSNDTTSVFYRGRIECGGGEADITECSVDVEAVAQCPHGLVQELTCTSCKFIKLLLLYSRKLLRGNSVEFSGFLKCYLHELFVSGDQQVFPAILMFAVIGCFVDIYTLAPTTPPLKGLPCWLFTPISVCVTTILYYNSVIYYKVSAYDIIPRGR